LGTIDDAPTGSARVYDEWDMLVRLAVAAVLGAAMGYDREVPS
jgi:uncharacterized membrane protein YhiD involved in acid resistance